MTIHRENNLEAFVVDVNEALQHFAPSFLGGTYERIRSDYVYQKGDLEITYNGKKTVVRWKKGEYSAPAIWSAVYFWQSDLNVLTAKTDDNSQVKFNVHSQDLWAELYRDRYGEYPASLNRYE